MRRRLVVTLGLLGALVLGGCAGTGAVAGDESPPSVTTGTPDTAAPGHDHRHSDVPVEISLEPQCVTPGEVLTVTVQTAPGIGVLYVAYYSDGKRGSKKPMGAGYGGNGGGYAENDGSFQDSWTVSRQAPAGPGRLKVVTTTGQVDETATFTVADHETGSC